MEFHKYTISKIGMFRKTFKIFEDDRLKYTVSTPGWLGYKYLIFKNRDGKDVLVVERKSFLLNRHFQFVAKGGLNAMLTRSMFAKMFTLESEVATYVAQSNWLGDEYTIYLGDNDIAKVSRKFFSNNKQYGIAIMEGNHDLFILGMVVCVELVRMTQNQ